MHTQPGFSDHYMAGAENAPEQISEALQPGIPYEIRTANPLGHDDRLDCDITALITTHADLKPGQSFTVLDLRMQPTYLQDGMRFRQFGNNRIDPTVDFMLVTPNFTDYERPIMKGIRLGESIEVGRANEELTKRFGGFKPTTSKTHFTITYEEDGRLSIIDNNSGNGTNVTTAEKMQFLWPSKEQQYAAFGPSDQDFPTQPRPIIEEDKFGFNPVERQGFTDVATAFTTEMQDGVVDEASLAGVYKHVLNLRKQGVPDSKIFKQIAVGIHPDLAQRGSAEQLRRTALYQALGRILGK
jgi:hypothetical protein